MRPAQRTGAPRPSPSRSAMPESTQSDPRAARDRQHEPCQPHRRRIPWSGIRGGGHDPRLAGQKGRQLMRGTGRKAHAVSLDCSAQPPPDGLDSALCRTAARIPGCSPPRPTPPQQGEANDDQPLYGPAPQTPQPPRQRAFPARGEHERTSAVCLRSRTDSTTCRKSVMEGRSTCPEVEP